MSTAQRSGSELPMGFIESVRVAGWRGQRFAAQPVEVAAQALRRNIKGARRREAAQRRIQSWRASLAGRERVHVTEALSALAVDEPGHPLLVFVDIELDSQQRISQIGVVVDIAGVRYRAEAASSDTDALTRLFAAGTVVAHNGTEHDFPRLAAIGVALTDQRIDTLRWSWLAWPMLESHALGALLVHHGISTVHLEDLHDAVVDADALANLFPLLLAALHSIAPGERVGLINVLGSAEPPTVTAWMLGSPRAQPAALDALPWSTDSGALPAPSAVVTALEHHQAPPGAVTIVPSIRAAVASYPESGLIMRPCRVIDEKAAGRLAPGWPKALARRVVSECRGALDLAPPSAQSLIADLGRTGSQPLALAGSPLLADLATASIAAVDRHLVLRVPLASLFEPVDTGVAVADPVGSPDADTVQVLAELGDRDLDAWRKALTRAAPADLRVILETTRAPGIVVSTDEGHRWMVDAIDAGAHPAGATLVVDGPIGGDRSTGMWRLLFGSAVHLSGVPSQKQQWTAIEGALPSTPRRPGSRAAELLAIAAAAEASAQRTLVVDTAAHRQAVEPTARSVWRSALGTPLLRPPGWPTVDESARRLGARSAYSALVSPAGAHRLAGAADVMLVARQPLPARGHPTLRRMVTDDLIDPFGSVMEPLAAHLAAQLVCASPTCSTMLADQVGNSTVLAELLGQPKRVHIAEMMAHPTVSKELFAALDRARSRTRAHEGAARAAARRLLPDGARLRPFQQSVIDDLVGGRDVLAVFRTGLGKSLCYQVPALAFGAADALTVVVSPLIALQRDQVTGLRRRGIAEAVAYNSELPYEIRAAIRRGIAAGFYSIVFVAPEGLRNAALQHAFATREVALLAIDEAHCISEMGHNFRPDYRELPRLLRRIIGMPDGASLGELTSRPRIVALTGTASPRVIEDIKGLLS